MDSTTEKLLTDIEHAAAAVAAADRSREDERSERDRLIVAAHEAGVTMETIGRHAGMSRQGVAKIIGAAR